MVYTVGFFFAFCGLLIMLFGIKNFYSNLNKWNRLGFILLCLGLILPMIYGFIDGIKSSF